MCSNSKYDLIFCKEHSIINPIYTDTCNICLDNMSETIYMDCGHSFHKDCITRWLTTKNTCPCCRKTLIENNQNEQENYQTVSNYNIDIIIFGNSFLIWFHEIVYTYIEDMDGVSFRKMLYDVDFYSYINGVYNEYITNRPIDLFELRYILNQTAEHLRYTNNETIDINELEFTTFEYESYGELD